MPSTTASASFSLWKPSDALQVGNIQLGIPVRLIRKNVDKGSEQGNIFIYDGLYNVVRLFHLLRVDFCRCHSIRNGLPDMAP